MENTVVVHGGAGSQAPALDRDQRPCFLFFSRCTCIHYSIVGFFGPDRREKVSFDRGSWVGQARTAVFLLPCVRIAPELNGRFPSVILRIADLKACKLILSMSEAL